MRRPFLNSSLIPVFLAGVIAAIPLHNAAADGFGWWAFGATCGMYIARAAFVLRRPQPGYYT